VDLVTTPDLESRGVSCAESLLVDNGIRKILHPSTCGLRLVGRCPTDEDEDEAMLITDSPITVQSPEHAEGRSIPSAPCRTRGTVLALATAPRRSHEFVLAPEAASVPTARRAVRETLQRWGESALENLLDDVELLTCELVTNAVQHAGDLTDMISISVIEDHEGGLLLGVRDNHPAVPEPKPQGAMMTCGRGLQIVLALVVEAGGYCGMQVHEHGSKTIWIRLPGVFS
jgi:anti-sigma regulatory factor (Ser/Thr protein kinase)